MVPSLRVDAYLRGYWYYRFNITTNPTVWNTVILLPLTSTFYYNNCGMITIVSIAYIYMCFILLILNCFKMQISVHYRDWRRDAYLRGRCLFSEGGYLILFGLFKGMHNWSVIVFVLSRLPISQFQNWEIGGGLGLCHLKGGGCHLGGGVPLERGGVDRIFLNFIEI